MVEFKPGWLQEQVAKSVQAIKRLEAAGFKIPTVRKVGSVNGKEN